MGNVVSSIVSVGENVWDSVFGGVEDVFGAIVSIGKMLFGFFSEVEHFFKIFINMFNLIKELFMGGIIFVKNVLDIFLESITLIERINDLIIFAFELLTRYLSAPIALLLMIPFFLISNYMIDGIDKVVSKL